MALVGPSRGLGPRVRRPSAALGGTFVAAALVAAALVAACGSTPPVAPSATAGPVATGGPGPSAAPTTATRDPGAAATPASRPTPSPTPAPTLAVAPLTGRLVARALTSRHPVAVMVDDHWAARPQSGFSEASVVWQAPAEGGIPRYMMVFGEGDPPSVGPVRSARLYFVQWAAEWNAVYVHVGGSPQAIGLLREKGQGQLVFDADEFRWGGLYLWRATDRSSPHNVYTDGAHLRALAKRVGAAAVGAKPAWRFADPAPLCRRPAGATIDLAYQYGRIGYRYDRPTNTWERSVDGRPQVDRANDVRVAPANVVVMEVAFGLLGPNQKGRLEAANIGRGRAWIATNGVVIEGTWRKTSIASPTRFYDADGRQVTLVRGQTFVQVIPPGTPLTIVDGRVVIDPAKAAARGIR